MSRVVNAAPPPESSAPESEAAPRAVASAGQVPRVLCVDDEPAMLAVLQRTLGAQFEVVTEADPLMALELLQHSRFAVIISDMKMPRMSGSTFLERVKTLAPASTRLALTAGLDWQLSSDVAFGILTKPCPVPLLQATVTAAAQFHELMLRASNPTEPRASQAVSVPIPRASLPPGFSSTLARLDEPGLAASSGLPSVALTDSVLRPRHLQSPRAVDSGEQDAEPRSIAAPAARRLAVVVLGARVELWPRATLLGSAMDCDIVTIDPRIAPRLLRFFNSWRGVTIQDVSGKGNVRLNGERLVDVRFVEPGDRIDLGPFDLTVEALDVAPAANKR
jgi:CheY-like chemotaxis protein